MSLTLLIILIVLLVVGWAVICRVKRRDNSNRYRHYQAQTEKQPKMRRNRYHKTSRREPDLGVQSSDKLEEMLKQVKIEPMNPKIEEQSDSATTVLLEDPDVVLGLKESPSLDLENREKPIPTNAQITLKPPPLPSPVITFYVMAEDGTFFNGYELLQAILSIGARFGEHQIFHRHEEKTGHGSVLFSLASATKPGTFDLSNMGNFSTPGLSLFFSADQVEDPIAVYELMLQTSGQLIEDLGGHVLDEQRQLLTPTTVVRQRRLLHEYRQGQQVLDLFEETIESE